MILVAIGKLKMKNSNLFWSVVTLFIILMLCIVAMIYIFVLGEVVKGLLIGVAAMVLSIHDVLYKIYWSNK